ncbi:acylneuraminate cytidylyltransferase family protein [Pedobacter sp. MW01-1-1]|uniref:acylneuraminate cytidylyltransferase family protein n=1 Tax=Pedobacter sp. MW01-1-1 TaxID=3383027 RepID=UPI003FED6A0C
MDGTLIIIPARAGSKGLPGKNTKVLGGLPLISHSLIFAEKIKGAKDVICVSSNDDDVLSISREFANVEVPFKRPEEMSSDTAGSYEVIMHAINHYENQGIAFENVLLLQPTSPFRNVDDYQNVKSKYNSDIDMVVTVNLSKNSPYFNLFEENTDGYLGKSKDSTTMRRQDCPEVYAFNGSMYLINIKALKKTNIQGFTKIIKSVMPDERSIDIDTMKDWKIAEYFLKEINNENS